MLKRLSALIVDPDVESRARLKEVLMTIAIKANIAVCRSRREAEALLPEKKGLDAIFVSSSFGQQGLEETLKALRSASRKVPLIVVLRSANLDSNLVASLFMNGASGFICEPFSAEAVLEHLRAVEETVKEAGESKDKLRSTFDFLVTSAMRHLDRAARQSAAGIEGGGYAMKQLKEVAAKMREVAEKIPESVPGILVNRFQKARPPRRDPAGVRTKRRERAPHPGEVLAKKITERRIDVQRLLSSLGVEMPVLEALLRGEERLNSELSERLARSIGETPAFWNGLQRRWDEQEKLLKQKEAQKKN